jgi:hypothetical protein
MKLNSTIWALLLILSAAGLVLHADTVTATVASVNGNVYATDSAGKSKRLKTGDTISIGSLIHTNVDSSIRLNLVPGASTIVTPGTDVVITTLDYSQSAGGVKTRKIRLTLNSGELFCSLAKHDGHSDFRVITPMGTSKAVGTVWEVSFSSSAGVTVGTVNGVVEITLPNGKVVSVPGGQVTTSPDGTTVVTGTLSRQQITEITSSLGGRNGGGGTFTISPGNNNSETINPANNSQNTTISPTE